VTEERSPVKAQLAELRHQLASLESLRSVLGDEIVDQKASGRHAYLHAIGGPP
jgi:hypothetical protein